MSEVKGYREVVFQDASTGKIFLTRSTAETSETIQYEGKQYPLVKVEISSDSHPVFTGKIRSHAPARRIDAFRKKWGR